MGKTTLSWLSTPVLASDGTVAVVDLEARNDLAMNMGVVAEIDCLGNRLYYSDPLEDLKPVACDIANVWVYASHGKALTALERELLSSPTQQTTARAGLAAVSERYDYVVVDTPGGASSLGFLALDVADVIVVPTGFDWLVGKGGKETVLMIKERRPDVPIVVVPNAVSGNRRYSDELVNGIAALGKLPNVSVAPSIPYRASATRERDGLPVTGVTRSDAISIQVRALMSQATGKDFA